MGELEPHCMLAFESTAVSFLALADDTVTLPSFITTTSPVSVLSVVMASVSGAAAISPVTIWYIIIFSRCSGKSSEQQVKREKSKAKSVF